MEKRRNILRTISTLFKNICENTVCTMAHLWFSLMFTNRLILSWSIGIFCIVCTTKILQPRLSSLKRVRSLFPQALTVWTWSSSFVRARRKLTNALTKSLWSLHWFLRVVEQSQGRNKRSRATIGTWSLRHSTLKRPPIHRGHLSQVDQQGLKERVKRWLRGRESPRPTMRLVSNRVRWWCRVHHRRRHPRKFKV